MTTSSSLFREKRQLEDAGLLLSPSMTFVGRDEDYTPLYEGKFISQFDHRFSSYHNLGKEKGRGGRGLPPVNDEEYRNPCFEVLPRYWVSSHDVSTALAQFGWQRRWLVCW
jgi:hypothetical protein